MGVLFASPFFKSLVFFFSQAHEGTVLRTVDSLNIYRVAEVAHVFIGTTDAVAAWLGGILDVAYEPCVITGELEG